MAYNVLIDLSQDVFPFDLVVDVVISLYGLFPCDPLGDPGFRQPLLLLSGEEHASRERKLVPCGISTGLAKDLCLRGA